MRILMVEDNEGDIILTLEALTDMRINNTVTIARDGELAIKMLSEGFLPDLVLLDINLPKVDGKDVLAYIKTREEIKHIPVIMLTTSTSEEDILETYRMHANCYISKPVNYDKFSEVVNSVERFWFNTVKLPMLSIYDEE